MYYYYYYLIYTILYSMVVIPSIPDRYNKYIRHKVATSLYYTVVL